MKKFQYESPRLEEYGQFGEVVVNGSGPDQGDDCSSDPDGVMA